MSSRHSSVFVAVPQERPRSLPAKAAHFRFWLPRKKLAVTQSTCGNDPLVIVVLSGTIVHAVAHTVVRYLWQTPVVLHTVLIAKSP